MQTSDRPPERPLERSRDGGPEVTVIIASYARPEGVARLLGDLAQQSLPASSFEVVVVDDGSPEPLAAALSACHVGAMPLTIVRQDNAGPAAARNRGVATARGTLLVFLDDDMRVPPTFLAAHVEAHRSALGDAHGDAHADPTIDTHIRTPRVILGALRAPVDRRLPLVERYRLFQMARTAQHASTHGNGFAGGDVYAGNVSLPLALFEQVGGFDTALRLSEDPEFGIRCEAAGAHIGASADAWAAHDTADPGLTAWVSRSVRYGAADLAVAARHADRADASPWRFLALVNPVSRPLLLAAALVPLFGRLTGWLVLLVASTIATLGLEGVALRLVTVSYGLLYFSGLSAGAGGHRAMLGTMQRYLVRVREDRLPLSGRFAKCVADIVADHDALGATDARYRADAGRRGLLGDAVQRIGFQIMIAYRVMRLFRAVRLGLFARLMSRLIRHLYGSDLHWDAELGPGVVLVHGMGLCVSHGARVGSGCILFQHVTLGESIHAVSRTIGSPTLEPNVHVAPGAVLLGPIVVGASSKVAANAVLTESVPAHSIVESPAAQVRVRSRGNAPVGEALPISRKRA